MDASGFVVLEPLSLHRKQDSANPVSYFNNLSDVWRSENPTVTGCRYLVLSTSINVSRSVEMNGDG